MLWSIQSSLSPFDRLKTPSLIMGDILADFRVIFADGAMCEDYQRLDWCEDGHGGHKMGCGA